MTTDEDGAPGRDLPDTCPKGHRLWWFQDGGGYGREPPRAWALCAGRVRSSGHIEVTGRCRHVWLWDGAGLQVVLRFNHETLTLRLRELAHQLGLFGERERKV